MKPVVAWQEHAEHVSAADNGDGTVGGAEIGKRPFERCADGIPQQRVGVRWIRRNVRDLAGHHQTLALRSVWAAFVGMSTVHDRGSTVEFALEEGLICIVADNVRHDAVGIRDHAVGGNDDVTFDAVQSRGSLLKDSQIAQQR